MDNPKESPAFQFYPTDWFGSRHVAAMTSSQRGIHASFIFAAWLEPVCGFPEGEEWLTARVLETEKTNCFHVLSGCWFLYKTFWFNERLLNERIKQINLSKTRIEVGRCGGRPLKSKIYNSKPIGNQLDSKHKPKKTKSEDGDINNISSNIDTLKQYSLEHPDTHRNLFEEFWKAYPRKVGKGSARRAWLKIKSPSAILEKIKNSLSWQINSLQWTKEGGQYIPHPSTYLNQERWLDSIPGQEKKTGVKNTIDISIIKSRLVELLGPDYEFPADDDHDSWFLLYETKTQ